MDFMFSLD